MGILAWLIVGAVAGWLAGVIMKGRGFGLLGDIIVGIIGALLGGFLAGVLLKIPNAISGFNVTTFVVAIVGSIIVIIIGKLIKGR